MFVQKEQPELRAEIIKALQRTGRKINDQKIIKLHQLYNTDERYPELIPILVTFLNRDITDLSILSELLRILSDTDARGLINERLFELYELLPKDLHERSLVGMALERTWLPEDIDRVITIVQDESNDYSRNNFIEILGATKDERAEDVLSGLLADHSTLYCTLRALRRKTYLKPYATIKKLEVEYREKASKKRKRSTDIHENLRLWNEYDAIKLKYKEILKYLAKADKKIASLAGR